MFDFGLQHLPLLIVGLVFGTTSISFYLAYIKYKHVTYLLPYISDTGTYPPESCIFGQSLNIMSVLLAFAMYVKYRQVQEMYKRHHMDEKHNLNKVTYFVGLVASLGINLVANFQETSVFWLHWCGAIMAFGGGSIYECLQTLIYIKISPIIGQRKTTMFRMILSFISVTTFLVFTVTAFISYGDFKGEDITKWKKEDGGYDIHQISTNAEWICAGSTMLYILLFYTEFKSISLTPIGVLLDEHKTTHSNVTLSY